MTEKLPAETGSLIGGLEVYRFERWMRSIFRYRWL